MKPVLKTLLLLLLPGVLFSQLTISGTLTDKKTGESLLFASVFIQGTSYGTTTNEYGYFSLTVPMDTVKLTLSNMGHKPKTILVHKGNVNKLDFGLSSETETIEEVTITVKRTAQEEIHNSTQMSAIKLPVKDIKNLPTIGGEADIVKVVQLLPGVQKGSEGGTGMFVRGGDADQNLVILDEATVYNIGHLLGFFSVFNQDAIKDVTMIKGAFPSNYGGRLSSVLDIRMNDGDMKEYHANGGFGLLSSRLAVEGPIVKDKASFMVSGRRTYIDQVFKWIGSTLPYYFYDVNAKVNYKVSEKDRIFWSGYIGNDVLDLKSREVDEDGKFNFGFTLGNVTSTLRWNHVSSPKHFSNYSLIYTNFDYNIGGVFPENNLNIRSAINDYGVKFDHDYFKSSKRKFKYGGSMVFHEFRPNVIQTKGEISDVLASQRGARIGAMEYGVYGYQIYKKDSSDWEFNTGLRLSGVTVTNKSYFGFEPRLALKYRIDKRSNWKLSFSTMRQYMHLVSSSTVALPTDLWYPVTENVKPQTSHQLATGYSYFLPKLNLNFTLEGYYKKMYGLTEYKEGANLVLNEDFESELLQGEGDSYGAEVLIKKDKGRWNGWISYTLSWSTREFDELNDGKWYYAKYDRRHNIALVSSLKLSKRWNFAAVWVYSTGSRFTPQIGYYVMPTGAGTSFELVPEFAARNSVKMSDTHRLDINFVFKGKEHKKFKSEWHFGAYNVYRRASPYSIRVVEDDENGGFKYEQPGLFGIIPSIAYNFSF